MKKSDKHNMIKLHNKGSEKVGFSTSTSFFQYERIVKTYLSKEKGEKDAVVLDCREHLVSGISDNFYSHHKKKDAISNVWIQHLHYS